MIKFFCLILTLIFILFFYSLQQTSEGFLSGTDIQLLGSYTGYDTYAYNVFNTTSPDLPTISTPSKTSQLYWKQQNHFKVKYTAV